MQVSLTTQPRLRADLRLGRRAPNAESRLCMLVRDPVLRGLPHQGFRVSGAAEALLGLLDGSRSIPELAVLLEAVGHHASPASVTAFVRRLEDLNLLDTDAVNRIVADLERSLAGQTIRPMSRPEARSPDAERSFRSSIADCFDGKPVARGERPGALLIPHAGVDVSGGCAAKAVQLLSAHTLPNLYVIVGPNHVAPGGPRAEIIAQPFQTPLGLVDVDREAYETLRQSPVDAVTAHLAHHRDHSIENVLVFLQWLHQHHVEPRPFRILPVLLTGTRHHPGMVEPQNHLALWRTLGATLQRLHADRSGDCVVVGSGDLSHIGPYFDLTPDLVGTEADVERWEHPVRQAILSADEDAFHRAWTATNACAGRPLFAMLEMAAGWRWALVARTIARHGDNFLSTASFAAFPRFDRAAGASQP